VTDDEDGVNDSDSAAGGGDRATTTTAMMWSCIGIEHEVNAGIEAADAARATYVMCFVRHIEGIRHHLHDPLAAKYVDVIDVNNMKSIERSRTNRLLQIKVGQNDHLVTSLAWPRWWGTSGHIAPTSIRTGHSLLLLQSEE